MAKGNTNRSNETGGTAFVGCLLIGMGLGMWAGRTAVGMFVGLGVGMLLMAFIRQRS